MPRGETARKTFTRSSLFTFSLSSLTVSPFSPRSMLCCSSPAASSLLGIWLLKLFCYSSSVGASRAYSNLKFKSGHACEITKSELFLSNRERSKTPWMWDLFIERCRYFNFIQWKIMKILNIVSYYFIFKFTSFWLINCLTKLENNFVLPRESIERKYEERIKRQDVDYINFTAHIYL